MAINANTHTMMPILAVESATGATPNATMIATVTKNASRAANMGTGKPWENLTTTLGRGIRTARPVRS